MLQHFHIWTQLPSHFSVQCPPMCQILMHSALVLSHMGSIIVRDPLPLVKAVQLTSGPCEDPPAQQQLQELPPDPTYASIQQLSDTIYDSGQTHVGSYNRASPFSGSVDPLYPPPLDVPGDGRWQGQPYYTPNADLQIPPPNDMRSPHPVYSPASNYPQYYSPASSAYPAGHSSSRGAVHTAAAAPTHHLQPMAISHAFYLDRANLLNPSSRNTTQLPNVRVSNAPSPVPFDVPPETSEPTIKKKRKRADARQLAALNRMYTRGAFPSTEERQQLARDLDMSARSVQNWSVLPLFATCIFLNYGLFSQVQEQKAGEPSSSPQPSSQPGYCNSLFPRNSLPFP